MGGKRQYAVINNSFLFRGSVKTNKSKRYLAFEYSNAKKFDLKKTFVTEHSPFNSLFKTFPLEPTTLQIPLVDAIKQELLEIGEVVFALVGEVQDSNEFSEQLSNADFKKLTLNPTFAVDFAVDGDEIKIKDHADIDGIWDRIQVHCDANGITYPDNFPTLIKRAIENLQRKAFSTLIIPTTYTAGNPYFLDTICDVLKQQIEEYKKNLARIKTDPTAMMEILRISYNFVSDVNKLLILVVNVCDLKPIILWLTLSKHLELDASFKDLPFGFLNTKPSLSEYERIIKNARNKSFHQLFPFNKSLRFELKALQDVTLTFLSSYSNKAANEIVFKDKELSELLKEFTRVDEQVVTENFWKKNVNVMENIYQLMLLTSDSIKAVR